MLLFIQTHMKQHSLFWGTSNLDFTPERIKAVDNVFVKSVYHRSMLPSVPDGKVKIISNGI